MNKENLSFTLSTGDQCELCMTELNHNVVALEPHIILSNPYIAPNHLQDIIDHIISLNRSYIKSLYFERIKYSYKFISFNLYGHIRAALKKELRRPISYDALVSNKDNYKWMEDDFLPKMTEAKTIINRHENKINKFLQVISSGSVNDTSYQLHDISINYNYVYDLHPTELIPIIDTYIKARITFSDNAPQEQKEIIMNGLKNWFNEFYMNISFQ